MEKIKIIEDRKSILKSANLILPSLLTDSELNHINGGGVNKPPTCTEISCGANYSLTACYWFIDCGENYSNGTDNCDGGFTTTRPCGNQA